MRKLLPLCCLLALSAATGFAGEPVVNATVTMASPTASPNTVVHAAVVVDVAQGYHINDHRPTLNYLIPTELKMELGKQVFVKDVTYPRGEAVRLAFSDVPLSVYQGSVRIDVALQVDRMTPAGNYTVKGDLVYQACNDHACLPPGKVPLTFTFKVVRRGAALRRHKVNAAS
jgi:thioredoxin:protein disulfide reductase